MPTNEGVECDTSDILLARCLLLRLLLVRSPVRIPARGLVLFLSLRFLLVPRIFDTQFV